MIAVHVLYCIWVQERIRVRACNYGFRKTGRNPAGSTIFRKRKTHTFIICAAIFDTMRYMRDSTSVCNSNTHLTSTPTGNHCTASLILVRPKDFACTTGRMRFCRKLHALPPPPPPRLLCALAGYHSIYGPKNLYVSFPEKRSILFPLYGQPFLGMLFVWSQIW